MIAVRSQTETRRGGPVPGLDRPSSRNPTAALPLVGSDPYVPCTPSSERGATGWGASVRFNFEVVEWVQVPHNTGRVPARVVRACPVRCRRGNVENACSPIRDKCKMNSLSRYHPS